MSTTKLNLKPRTTLAAAVLRRTASPLPVADEGLGGPIWAWTDNPYASFAAVLVRARHVETALEMVYDTLPAIPAEEHAEAYGYDTAEELDAAVAEAVETGDYPELVEGYIYADGKIVAVDVAYESISQVSKAEAREVYRFTIEAD